MIATYPRFLFPLNRMLVTFFIAVLCGWGAAVEAKIKCWTNNEGVRECGNSVPPEFAQGGYQEKSAGGVTVDSIGRAKSLEELEAERALDKERAAAALLESEKAAKDRVLLDTFSTEDDMVFARDGQISHLESQVKLTESHIEKLKKSLDDLIQEAADHERRGNEPPEKLLGDIDSLREQIRDNKAFIEVKFQERGAIVDKFELDIARFRKLKGFAD